MNSWHTYPHGGVPASDQMSKRKNAFFQVSDEGEPNGNRLGVDEVHTYPHAYPHGGSVHTSDQMSKRPKLDSSLQVSGEDEPTDDSLGVDEALIDGSQARPSDADIGKFLTRITRKTVAARSATFGFATNVRDGLTEGSTYRLKKISLLETRIGTRQVWTMEAVADKTVSRVWAPWVLTQHTYGNSGTEEIEPRNVQILKCLDITYKGSTSDDNDKIRYDFAFSRA